MSTQISTAAVQQYKSNVIMLAQQRGSRLRRTAREDGEMIGKQVFFDRIGSTTAVKNTVRHADTPLQTTQHTRRMAPLVDYDWADLIDSQDRLRTLFDPNNPYARNGSWAIGRAYDDELIAAASGSAATGETGSGSQALPSAQKIAAAATGLNLTKLISAREILDAADVDPDRKRFAVVTAEQVSDLLAETEVTSSDYASVKALVSGQIDTFMGFEFIRTERLAVDGSSDRLCLFYTEDAMGLQVPQDIMVDIGPRRDKRNATQVYICASLACVRIEDAQVVEVACVEA